MNRRSFLATASLLASGNILGLGPFGRLTAFAQSSQPDDYKALVCIMLAGGNDANNMLVPTDNTNYGIYAQRRASLALAQGTLAPLANTDFGLHPQMSELASLFNSKKMAVLANVGTLIQPLSAAQFFGNATLGPPNIGSHYDQQLAWESADLKSPSTLGWGGKIADRLGTIYGTSSFPMAVSVAGTSLLTNGAISQAFVVRPGDGGNITCSQGSVCDARLNAAQQLLTLNSGVSLVQADASISSDMYRYSASYATALAQGTRLQTPFPSNPFASQLQQIAQVIQLRSQLGLKRQIFFATLGGFDTHGAQLQFQANNLALLSQALQAFQMSLGELGMEDQVTTFTISDFSRSLGINSAGGTDHAWGGHHLILGGAVKGGGIYGTFPSLVAGGVDDPRGDAAMWVPTTSVAQYGATLASWFGVADSQLDEIFDVLPNFSQRNLQFI